MFQKCNSLKFYKMKLRSAVVLIKQQNIQDPNDTIRKVPLSTLGIQNHNIR